MPVHPHACGEVNRRYEEGDQRRGSSPRVWGSRLSFGSAQVRPGFIPTRVGKSITSRNCRYFGTVHPHACGEVLVFGSIVDAPFGLSPRVWGSPPYSGDDSPTERFIPTRVGKSFTHPPPGLLCSVHPHACGEVTNLISRSGCCCGSSPRVWGSRTRWRCACRWQRFIPTRVGKSPPATSPPAAPAVHPHACGEVLFSSHRGKVTVGSSPRVWGSPYAPIPGHNKARFIPTRVGKSDQMEENQANYAVHPHACGEVGSTSELNRPHGGSSPRVWGSLP